MCASLAEIFVSRYEEKYTFGRSSGVMRKLQKRVKVNYPLIDQVKAQFTLTIELISITKRAQMLLLAGNILWKIWIPPLAFKVSKEIIFV